MVLRLALALSFILAGCSDTVAEKSRKSRQERAQDAEAVLSKTPVPRTYRIDGSELKVIDVPVKDASNFVDVQRCFVWTNHEYKTSSISCNQQPELILSSQEQR